VLGMLFFLGHRCNVPDHVTPPLCFGAVCLGHIKKARYCTGGPQQYLWLKQGKITSAVIEHGADM
jgi:hypothetical protein